MFKNRKRVPPANCYIAVSFTQASWWHAGADAHIAHRGNTTSGSCEDNFPLFNVCGSWAHTRRPTGMTEQVSVTGHGGWSRVQEGKGSGLHGGWRRAQRSGGGHRGRRADVAQTQRCRRIPNIPRWSPYVLYLRPTRRCLSHTLEAFRSLSCHQWPQSKAR